MNSPIREQQVLEDIRPDERQRVVFRRALSRPPAWVRRLWPSRMPRPHHPRGQMMGTAPSR